MIKKIILTAFLSCYMLGLGYAQTDSEGILAKIKQANEAVTSIKSDFRQTMHMSFMDEDAVSNGKFFYRKPDKMLMKYSEPEGEMMLINGDNFSMVIMEQYTSASIKSEPAIQAISNILSSCLEGDVKKITGAKVAAVEKGNSYEVTITIPGSGSQQIQKVIAQYDKSDCSLSLIRTEDADDGFTLYELKGKMLNETIGDEVFVDSGK